MKFPYLKTSLDEVKKYCRLTGRSVFYQDQIKYGYSLKIEYLTTGVAADDTVAKLERRFPDYIVRLLEPNENVRPGGYTVRIWVE